MAETAWVVRVPPELDGVVVVVVVGVVVVPLELPVLGVDEPDDDEPVPLPPEDETTAGQPRRWSTTSCLFAAVSVAWFVARVCSAEVSCALAELRLEALCARWLAVPPASAVARVCSSVCSVAFAEASADSHRLR